MVARELLLQIAQGCIWWIPLELGMGIWAVELDIIPLGKSVTQRDSVARLSIVLAAIDAVDWNALPEGRSFPEFPNTGKLRFFKCSVVEKIGDSTPCSSTPDADLWDAED